MVPCQHPMWIRGEEKFRDSEGNVVGAQKSRSNQLFPRQIKEELIYNTLTYPTGRNFK